MMSIVQKLNWTKLNLRERVLFVITVVVVFWVVTFMFLVPTQKKVEKFRSELSILRSDIDRNSALLPELRSRVEQIKRRRSTRETVAPPSVRASDLLPGGNQLSSFLNELTRLGHRRHVEFVSIRPEAVEDQQAYMKMTLRLDVKAQFRQLGEYLMMLENLPRAILVDELKIEATPNQGPYILGQLKAVTFMAKE